MKNKFVRRIGSPFLLVASLLVAAFSLSFFVERDATSIAEDPFDIYGFDRLEEDTEWEEEDSILIDPNAVLANSSGTIQLDSIAFDVFENLLANTKYWNNQSNVLPISPAARISILDVSTHNFTPFLNRMKSLASVETIAWNQTTYKNLGSCQSSKDVLLVLLNEKEDFSKFHRLQQTLLLYPAVVVYFGEEVPEELLNWSATVLQIPDSELIGQTLATEVLMGAHTIYSDQGCEIIANRLGHAPPESVGVNREKLADINRLVERAIRKKAMPGCQILVAKNGRIIYDRNFGYHTYSKENKVESSDLYDIASITKAASTTLSVMAMEEDGLLKREDRLGAFFPEYKRSGLRYLRVRHLLAHHTGLQSNLPISRWYKEPAVFSRSRSQEYSKALAADFYLKGTIENDLLEELGKLNPRRRKKTTYGDVNFVLLQQLTERLSQQPLDQLLNDRFYGPMGLQRLAFKPALKYMEEEIVPTQDNAQWRGGLVRGIVHDEGAMLMNGVAGHAGLFSNAEDLASVFQMLLNEGTYSGESYFSPEIIEEYTSRNGYNHRAFGFDRLIGHSRSLRHYGASKRTFGHTAFTGGCVWADPENDLIYIFLSNRIHPDPKNNRLQRMGLRERIHKIIYKSLRS